MKCGDCRHFTPNKIGAYGIGDCKVNAPDYEIPWASFRNGKWEPFTRTILMYPNAERECNRHEKEDDVCCQR